MTDRGGWLQEIGRQLRGFGDAVLDELHAAGISTLLEPVQPWNRSVLLSSAIAVGGLVSVLLLSGIAVAALGALLLALVALYLLLAEVFGLSFELHPFPPR